MRYGKIIETSKPENTIVSISMTKSKAEENVQTKHNAQQLLALKLEGFVVVVFVVCFIPLSEFKHCRKFPNCLFTKTQNMNHQELKGLQSH